jgi:hypothetical protein
MAKRRAQDEVEKLLISILSMRSIGKKTNEPGIRNRMAWLICFEEEKEKREIEGYLTTG